MKQSRKTRHDSQPEARKNGRFPLNELKNRCGLTTEMLVKYTRSFWWTRIHSKMRNENDSLKANDAVFQGIYDKENTLESARKNWKMSMIWCYKSTSTEQTWIVHFSTSTLIAFIQDHSDWLYDWFLSPFSSSLSVSVLAFETAHLV